MIVLPLPPSVNGLYGGGSGQRRFKSAKYNKWIVDCLFLLTRDDYLLLDRVELTYTYYFPDKRSRDCENYVKAVSDFLVNQQVIKDDDCFHVPKLTIIFGGIDKGNPRVEIQIQKAE